MYIVVISDDRLKVHNADIYDDLAGVKSALKKFKPEYGFSTLIFTLDPEEGTYVEIFPEELDYEQE